MRNFSIQLALLLTSLLFSSLALHVPSAFTQDSKPKAVIEMGDGVSLVINELKRTKYDTILVKGIIKNESDKIVETSKIVGGDLYGLTLIDMREKKKYFALKEGPFGAAIGTDFDRGPASKIRPHSEIQIWTQLTAPPPDIKQISIQFRSELPVDDVTID